MKLTMVATLDACASTNFSMKQNVFIKYDVVTCISELLTLNGRSKCCS